MNSTCVGLETILIISHDRYREFVNYLIRYDWFEWEIKSKWIAGVGNIYKEGFNIKGEIYSYGSDDTPGYFKYPYSQILYILKGQVEEVKDYNKLYVKLWDLHLDKYDIVISMRFSDCGCRPG